MILYDENKNKIDIPLINKIGGRTHGNVYKISDNECIKIYDKNVEIDTKVLKLIKELELKNYYRILELYYTIKGQLKGNKMIYYNPENIDILTMPTEYTLKNLFDIADSIEILTQNNIQVEDTHSENIIMDKKNITITDVDLYSFNRFRTKEQLEIKNTSKLAYLFKEIYIEAISDYHIDYKSNNTSQLINELFTFYTPNNIEKVYKKLTRYKYPIDYIKHNSR